MRPRPRRPGLTWTQTPPARSRRRQSRLFRPFPEIRRPLYRAGRPISGAHEPCRRGNPNGPENGSQGQIRSYPPFRPIGRRKNARICRIQHDLGPTHTRHGGKSGLSGSAPDADNMSREPSLGESSYNLGGSSGRGRAMRILPAARPPSWMGARVSGDTVLTRAVGGHELLCW